MSGRVDSGTTDRRAVISCDLDPVEAHLRGYGLSSEDPARPVYQRALPRILELARSHRIRLVLFVVAREAREHADVLRQACDEGHEVASHSLDHPEPFLALDPSAIRTQVRESKRLLEEVTGRPVLGFRTPGLGRDTVLTQELTGAGYRYSSSLMPSPVMTLRARRLASIRRRAGGGSDASRVVARCLALGPHRIPDSPLWEFPLAVTPRLRIPAYHTLSHLLPRRVQRWAMGGVPWLSYVFHGVDALDQEPDGVDPRLGRHPGMDRPWAEKWGDLDDLFGFIASRWTVSTYADWLADAGSDSAAG